MDEILAGAGMSGFVSILDPPEDVPHLQALVDDIKGEALMTPPAGRLKAGRVIPLPRRDAPDAEKEPEPLREPGIEKQPDIEKVPGAERDTRPPPEPAVPSAKRFHVRRAVLAQDGHSSGEEVLYQTLWNSRYSRQESKETRLVTIGWKAMSKLARLTPRNTRRNCEALIEKLAIEQLSDENSRESIGRTYRLYSYKTILERRRAAGMEWVTRTRGVTFVPAPPSAAGEPPAKKVPGPETTPDIERDPGAKRDTGSNIIKTLRDYLPDIDDPSILGLIEACRQKAPDATEDEIDHFVRIKADLMQRMGTVKSPMGFLKTSVPRCFEGESFRQFRHAETKRREATALREASQEEELRRFQDEQRAILNNPKASEEDRRFARNYLGIPSDSKGTGA